MNTPSHMSLALAVLGRKPLSDNPSNVNAAIIWGALFPDLTMFALFLYERLRGTPVDVIFDEKYFGDLWQIVVSLSNSIPIFAAIAIFAYFKGYRGAMFFALAALLHCIFDLPLHREDAHMHFYPLTEFKYISPVSYYETRHYGQFWSPIELILIAVSTFIGIKALVTRWGKISFALVMAGAAAIQIVMIYFQWVHGGMN